MSKLGYIQRYLFIIKCVRKYPCCNLKEISEYVQSEILQHDLQNIGVSDKTLKRDITDIKLYLGLSIEYDYIRKGYYIPEDEIQSSTIENTLDSFFILNSLGGDTGKPDFIYPEKRKPIEGNANFALLKKAIEKTELVEFDYHKFFPDEIDTRRVQPHALMQSRNRWYLLGFDQLNVTQSRSFALERISNLTLLGIKFAKDCSIDWQEKYKDCFAMFTSEAPSQKVVFTVDQRDGYYVETMPIHHSQKLYRNGERVRVELNIEITLDFIMELMSRSWTLEVLEPISLRETVHQILVDAETRNRI